jgi:hypothetical protein
MAASDARLFPLKNTALRVSFSLRDASNDLVTGATCDSEVPKDGAAFADCTNEATEIGATGIYYLDLTSTEMNADTVIVQVKSGGSAKVLVLIMYPLEDGDIPVNLKYWNGSAVASPDTAGYPKVTIKSGTGTGEVSLSSGTVTAGTVSDKTGYALSSSGVDAIWDETLTEPSGIFAWAGSFRDLLNFLGALMRNKMTQTATTTTLRNDADNASIATSTVADDGTTFTRGELS